MPTTTAVPPATGALSVPELLTQASVLQQAGQPAAAAALYEGWLATQDAPLRHVVLFNLGTLLSTLQRDADAEVAYRDALRRQPDFAHALLNLGHVLERRGAHDEALATWQRVVDTQAVPELRLHAHNNRGRLLELLRRFPEAEAELAASLQLEPKQFDAIQHYVHLRQKQCKWPAALPVGEVTPYMLMIGTSLLAMMSESDDPALQLLTAQRFVHERCPKPPAAALHAAGPKRSGRIRIGYLSGDLHMHAVGLLIPELLELHDRSKFEVFGFCWTPESQMPQRQRLLRALDQHVRLAGVDDATAAKLIAEAGIDVLVDLQGLTSGARPGILGHRAAPVQVSYLGLPGTSALPGVDWILADRFVIPEHMQRFYSEKPIYLPHCYQVSDRHREVAPTPQRSSYGLPDDRFVFCSFNNNFKFTQDMFRCWMRILQQVPDSVLWLLADNETARDNMLREADAHAIARERLIFAPRVAPPEYLARFQLADLVLDTFPYNAGTTASDALWMGTPILTLAGRSYISRMAGSLLTAVGLPDLITETLADYERLAVAIGRTPARAASYKRYLAEHGRQSPLFDLPRLVRDIETQFERLALAQR
ncbi:O-linked N-acetylglucosamine transferase, SPINDLY family protein [Aquabacterium humicola]|uniref:O-linked N-acetylglucosamine transferase, SPINDLY family protein n=1 Tax=Aquabacterium humicola TaxID=3237377 RepID=UPI0025431718|nr:tetratricopeptide repeat protein [Rubrivivax pictus]